MPSVFLHAVESRGAIPLLCERLEQGLCPTELREIIHTILGSKGSRSVPKIFAGQYEVGINLLIQNKCLHHMQKIILSQSKLPLPGHKTPI